MIAGRYKSCNILLKVLLKRSCRVVLSKYRQNKASSWTEPCTNQVTRYSSSINTDEVEKFSRLADHWWRAGGEFDALRSLNELRVPLIRGGLLAGDHVTMDTNRERNRESGTSHKRCPKPLKGLRVLDVGCGGGILSEPLARLGADVTGLDASADNIEAAKTHAEADPGLSERLQYTCSTVEDLSVPEDSRYDGVVASEILEHVSNPQQFVSSCCQLVKPRGSLFLTSLNQTWLSYALAIVAAEQVLRVVPAGAHDWEKFIPPQTVQSWLEEDGFQVVLLHGMLLNPLTNRWRWISDTSMNYAIHAIKTS